MTPLIEIVGLGAGDINQLPLGIYRKLTKEENNCYARTIDHPVMEALAEEAVSFTCFDDIYKKHDQFEAVYQEITEILIEKAKEKGKIVYAVPGHPMLAEQTVQLLLRQEEAEIDIIGGQSFLDDLFSALKIDPIEGFQFLDATSFRRHQLQYEQHLIFCQVYDAFVASEIKLTLLEDLPVDHSIFIVEAAGSNQERVKQIPLVELDQQTALSNVTSVYIPPVEKDQLNHQFFRLREVIQALRAPDGCPWDRKQTHQSLKKYLIEETYEVIESIDAEDDEAVCEELGDVLLQVMLHSQIAEEEGFFTVDDVIYSITEKMIRRHPHVFGEAQVKDVEDVMRNWKAIKEKEKNQPSSSILADIPASLPATLLAEQVQKKAKAVGFDWGTEKPIWDKIYEEMEEWQETLYRKNPADQEKEFGDILFAWINLGRYYQINPETALLRTVHKFKQRFLYIEEKVKESKLPWNHYSLEELDAFWEEAKKFENG